MLKHGLNMFPPARTFARGHTVGLWALFCLRSDADEVEDDGVLKLLMVVLMMMFYIEFYFLGCYGDVHTADDGHGACACIPDDVSEDGISLSTIIHVQKHVTSASVTLPQHPQHQLQ